MLEHVCYDTAAQFYAYGSRMSRLFISVEKVVEMLEVYKISFQWKNNG